MAMKLSAWLRKKYASGFDLNIEAELSAGFTILFGASGAGKTTVLECLAGLEKPDEGKITLGDRVLFDALTNVNVPAHERRVGYVFQSHALFPHLSVQENIGFGTTNGARVAELIEDIGLVQFAERKPAELSAGQRQRVALARALAPQPQFLLMDEPMAALDARTKSSLLEFLRKWNDTHAIPIVYVTHDREEAYSLGERLLVIEDGRVAAAGSPHDVMSMPTRNSIAHLAGFENVLACEVVSEQSDQGTLTCRIAGTEVVLEVPRTQVQGAKVTVGIRAGDILVAAERPRGISARNILLGTIESVEMRGTLVRVLVSVKGAKFEAHITPGAQVSLGIGGGKSVWLVIKTYSCHLLNA